MFPATGSEIVMISAAQVSKHCANNLHAHLGLRVLQAFVIFSNSSAQGAALISVDLGF